ncbi:MAG: hypothetical protein V3V08_23305 [Nannocystaceae bacterium]
MSELEMSPSPVTDSLPDTAEILTDKPAASAPVPAAPAAAPEAVEKLEATNEPPAPTPGWRGGLSEEMRGHERLAAYTDDAAGLQQYVEESLITEKAVRKKGFIEPVWKDEDDVKRFYVDQGMPEEASGYKLEGFEMPEGGSEGVKDALLGLLHSGGATERQVAMWLPGYMALQEASQQAEAEVRGAAAEEGMAALKKKWGRGFPANLDLANRALTASQSGVDSEAIRNIELKGGGVLGDHHLVIEAFQRIGSTMSEGSLLGPKTPGIRPLSPESAESKLDALWLEHGKKGGALVDAMHPDHESVMREKTALSRAMHPENLEQ